MVHSGCYTQHMCAVNGGHYPSLLVVVPAMLVSGPSELTRDKID